MIHGHGRFGSFLVGGGIFLLMVSLLSCGQRKGRLMGQMYVPPGLQGNAQWGDIWLVHDYERLRDDLVERERLLVLALLSKDADFLRQEKKQLMELGVIRAKLEVLNRGEVPVRAELPSDREITPLVTVDTLIAGIRVQSRPATAPELATEIERMKRVLKDSAIVIRDRMERLITELRGQRSEQKRLLLAGADGVARQVRIASSPVGMDGRYFFDGVPWGNYGLYARYRLLEWYVLAPATVVSGDVRQDIPRLPGPVLESKAVVNLDALCAQIARM